MKNLIEKLTEQTKNLKELYINQTKSWAERYYNRIAERFDWTEEKWCNFLGLTPTLRGSRYTFPSGFYNTSASRDYSKYLTEVRNMRGISAEQYIRKEVKYAEMHYTKSIVKLADRISKKGLNMEVIEIKDASVGVNINTTITDGVKTVKAYTIVAEGEIQRPHYRYLIK